MLNFKLAYDADKYQLYLHNSTRPANQRATLASMKTCFDQNVLHALFWSGEVEAESVETITDEVLTTWMTKQVESTNKEMDERVLSGLANVFFVLKTRILTALCCSS